MSAESELELRINYHGDPERKRAFLEFTPKALYGASFVEWDRRGCWNENYLAYSLFDTAGRIVSNVSISTMTLLIHGREKRGVQFSAVGTLPEFYKLGLSRRLMQRVLDDYREKCDLFFLFANDSVLDFYPKFGFRRVHENLFRAKFPQGHADNMLKSPSVRTLSMNDDGDLNILRDLAKRREPVTQLFGARGDEHILYFYALLVYGDSILYWPEEEIALVMETDEDKPRELRIMDIISPGPVSLRETLPPMVGGDFDEILFYFTPELFDLEYRTAETYEDSPLFVLGDFPLQDEQGEGRAFKFPALAQT